MKQRDVVRTIYLYLVTVVGIVMALTGVIGTLTNLLNMYVFQLVTPDNMQSEIAMLLSFASAVAVGIPVWLYHWGIIQESRHHVGRSPATESATQAAAEITAPVESPRRDFIRRLYIYLLSAIGLFIVMFNLVNLASSIYRAFAIPMLMPVVPEKPDGALVSERNIYAIQSLTRTAVGVLVGLPVWLYHWRLGQREHQDVVDG